MTSVVYFDTSDLALELDAIEFAIRENIPIPERGTEKYQEFLNQYQSRSLKHV